MKKVKDFKHLEIKNTDQIKGGNKKETDWICQDPIESDASTVVCCETTHF